MLCCVPVKNHFSVIGFHSVCVLYSTNIYHIQHSSVLLPFDLSPSQTTNIMYARRRHFFAGVNYCCYFPGLGTFCYGKVAPKDLCSEWPRAHYLHHEFLCPRPNRFPLCKKNPCLVEKLLNRRRRLSFCKSLGPASLWPQPASPSLSVFPSP